MTSDFLMESGGECAEDGVETAVWEGSYQEGRNSMTEKSQFYSQNITESTVISLCL